MRYKKNSTASVRKRTIPIERPPLVSEVSANFFADTGCHVVSNESLRPYSRLSCPDSKERLWSAELIHASSLHVRKDWLFLHVFLRCNTWGYEITFTVITISNGKFTTSMTWKPFRQNPAVALLHVQPFSFAGKPNPCPHNSPKKAWDFYSKDEIKRGTIQDLGFLRRWLWSTPSPEMWRRVDLVRTDVSQEHVASILRVKNTRARKVLGVPPLLLLILLSPHPLPSHLILSPLPFSSFLSSPVISTHLSSLLS
jgi:hypothetical protein